MIVAVGFLLAWIALIPALIAWADRPRSRFAKREFPALPRAWIVRECCDDKSHTIGCFREVPSVATHPARVIARGIGSRFTDPASISIDVWHETCDVFSQLALYPTDGYAHCRVAYNIPRRAIVMIANEVACP